MAGVGFDHQPDFFSRFELQGFARGQGEMDFQFHAAVYSGRNDHIPAFEQKQAAGNYVSCAQADRRRNGQQNVAGTDTDAESRSHFGAHQRRFQWDGLGLHSRFTLVEQAAHGAAIGVERFHGRVQNVLEPCQIRNGFLLRGA